MKFVDFKGGYRKKLKINTAQGRAIDKFMELYGGLVAFGRALGLPHQLVGNWRLRGKVPMERIGPTVRVFSKDKVTQEYLKFLFNYEDMVAFTGVPTKGEFSWKNIVGSIFENKSDVDYIMGGSSPKVK